MMSVSTLLTRGYGSFGDVTLLPTWGYGIAVYVDGPFRIVESLAYSAGAETHLSNAGGATFILANSGGAASLLSSSAGSQASLANSAGSSAVQGL